MSLYRLNPNLTDPSNSLVNVLVDKVEVLYVLGLLLVGKHMQVVGKEWAKRSAVGIWCWPLTSVRRGSPP